MLTRFTCTNYKNLDADVELGPINVLIGPNNSGKSNFLEALSFLWDAVGFEDEPGSLAEAMRLRGPTDIVRWKQMHGSLTWHNSHSELRFNLEHDEDSDHVGPITARWPIPLAREVDPAYYVNTNPDGSPIIDSPLLDGSAFWPVLARKSGLLTTPAFHRISEVTPSTTTKPRPAGGIGTRLRPDGTNLAAYLQHLARKHPEALQAINKRLRIPLGLRDPKLSATDYEHTWPQLGDGDAKPKALSTYSDGTARLVYLACLLGPPNNLSTLAIDEPELNLHPAWIRTVGRWMNQRDGFDQLVVSTHSPELLDQFTDGFRDGDVKVHVFENHAGNATVKTLEHKHVSEFLDEGAQLGDLYRDAEPALGGWPW